MIEKEMTTNEELVLMNRCGRENPFRTPEGYFEALPQQVMDRIRQRRKRNHAWKWAVAAIMTSCVFAAGFKLAQQSDVAAEEARYMEDELNYSMINNMDIVYYLTEAE